MTQPISVSSWACHKRRTFSLSAQTTGTAFLTNKYTPVSIHHYYRWKGWAYRYRAQNPVLLADWDKDAVRQSSLIESMLTFPYSITIKPTWMVKSISAAFTEGDLYIPSHATVTERLYGYGCKRLTTKWEKETYHHQHRGLPSVLNTDNHRLHYWVKNTS